METALLSFGEYEYLKNIAEVFERFEIKELIQERSKNYDPKKNISWNEIKLKIGKRDKMAIYKTVANRIIKSGE
jgi:hypothetical protein